MYTEPAVNVPAIVESEVSRILNKHGSMPRDAFRQLIGSLSTRFEQHAMDLEFAGKDEEECFPHEPTSLELQLQNCLDDIAEKQAAENFGIDAVTGHIYDCGCPHCQRILGKLLATVEA